MRLRHLFALVAALVALFVAALWSQTTPPSSATVPVVAGTSSVRPSGKIAFINDGDIWTMDADGKNRQKICEIKNAKGRISFSPDNKMIAFSREGKEQSNLPSGEGGGHLLHDIFIAYTDSAAGNPTWWRRKTFSLGAHHPEWSADGNMIYCQNDVHANEVDFIVPSFQVSAVEAEGGNMAYLRKDWQRLNMSMAMPSVSADGSKLAYVIMYAPDPDRYIFQYYGIKVINMTDIMKPETDMRLPTPELRDGYAPAWSPDGQWLAYVASKEKITSLVVIKSDMTEKRTLVPADSTRQVMLVAPGWSPDSRWLVFATTDGVIYTISRDGKNMTALTGAGKFSSPAWSK